MDSLITELRDKVERETACTFNYVLLNLYKDGNDYISHHKDNESCLDSTFHVIVLIISMHKELLNLEDPTFPPRTWFTLQHGEACEPSLLHSRYWCKFIDVKT